MANLLPKQVDEIYQKLLQAQADGRLNESGRALLQGIDSGAITSPQLGMMMQGFSYSSSDEIAGFMRSRFPALMGGSQDADLTDRINRRFNTDYSQQDIATELERRPMRAYQEENPWKAVGLEAAGGFVSGGPLGAARSTGRNLALAGASGAVSGYMAGEGDFEARAGGAVVGSVASVGGQGLLDLAKGPFANAYKALFMSGKNQMNRTGRQLAQKQIIEAIESEGLSVEEAIQRVAALHGKQFTLADLNDNTRALVDAVSVLPGPGKAEANTYLRQRAAGRTGRISGFLQEAFGKKAQFYQDFQAMKAARGANADKLYGNANKIRLPVDNEMQTFLQNPVIQDAYRKAMRIAQIKGDTGGVKFRLTEQGDILNPDGERVSEVPTLFLHYIKMGIDDVAFPKMPQQGIGATEVNAIRDLRTQFLDYLDASNPAYGRARNTYAGDTAVMNAMELGRDFLRTKDTDELAAMLRRMNPSEKEAFRLGSLNALQDQLDLSPETANIAFNMVKTDRKKQLLRLAFPNTEKGAKDFDVFFDNLNREVEMHRTERAGFNSATAQRTELVNQMRNQVATSTDLPRNTSDILFKNLRDRGAIAEDQALISMAGEMSRILTQTDPKKLNAILAELDGGGDLLTIVKAKAPELLPKILPFFAQGATRAPLTGNIIGGQSAELNPTLFNQDQQALMQ